MFERVYEEERGQREERKCRASLEARRTDPRPRAGAPHRRGIDEEKKEELLGTV
jgi:hypothetical protein